MLMGLTGPSGPATEVPADGVVTAETLAVHVEPDAASVAPERLHKGDKVQVIDLDRGSGWVTIERPASAFDWVERSAIRAESTGLGRVSAAETVVRVGVDRARLPGPPQRIVRRGAMLRLLDRPPLVVGKGSRATTWLAVAPTRGEVRYARGEGINWRKSEPVPEIRVGFETSDTRGPAFPREIASEMASIEAQHRALLEEPAERWQFDQVRGRYEGLLKQVSDPTALEAIRARLDLIGRQEQVARSARNFRRVLERSRRLDQDVAVTLHRLGEMDQPRRQPFVAEGMIQRSSRLVDGHRVYVLIGATGDPVAYLDVPAGLDARPALAKRVGVRGSVHYNEKLGSRLIAVRDMETLE